MVTMVRIQKVKILNLTSLPITVFIFVFSKKLTVLYTLLMAGVKPGFSNVESDDSCQLCHNNFPALGSSMSPLYLPSWPISGGGEEARSVKKVFCDTIKKSFLGSR